MESVGEGRGQIGDLHLHSLVSDGTLTPTELVAAAAQAGVDTMALTDHDSTLGIVPALLAAQEWHVEVIPGLEMTAGVGGEAEGGRRGPGHGGRAPREGWTMVIKGELKCYHCGYVSASATGDVESPFREWHLRLAPICDPCRVWKGGRLRCCRCGGPIFMDERNIVRPRVGSPTP